MTKQLPLIVLTACIATFSLIGIPTAQAKQQCSAAMPANPRAYWSWRLIDGRKCWYEGKPTLSKSLLEWPARASSQPPPSNKVVASTVTKGSSIPDSEELAQTDANTFDALWRTRVEQR
jgi:hypothetical protein